jgi:hypothetical protein
MSEELVVLRTFSDDIAAGMARLCLQKAGIRSFMRKNNKVAQRPHSQRTTSVHLVANRADVERAHQIFNSSMRRFFSSAPIKLEIL